MSKRKITMIVLSLLVIIGLGFAGYSAMNKGNKSANNTYSSDKTSASSTSKAPAKSASAASSTSATSKPEKKATDKSKSETAALKNESQEKNKSKAKIATIKKNHHSSASASKVVATAKAPAHKSASASTCSLTVRGPISKGNKVMLRGSRVEITRGETVASVLKKVAKEKHVSLAYQGGGGSTYIRGIGGLFEFDHGSGSGWLYSVNNKFPGYAAGKKKVKSGDNIQWLYTENLGKDRHSPVASQH